jgi:hypothetical protein
MENPYFTQGMGEDKSPQPYRSSTPIVPPTNLSMKNNAYMRRVPDIQSTAERHDDATTGKHPSTTGFDGNFDRQAMQLMYLEQQVDRLMQEKQAQHLLQSTAPTLTQPQRQLQNLRIKKTLLEDQDSKQNPAEERDSFKPMHGLSPAVPIASFGNSYQPGPMLPAQQIKNLNDNQHPETDLQTNRSSLTNNTRALSETPSLDDISQAPATEIDLPATSHRSSYRTSLGSEKSETIRPHREDILKLFEQFLERSGIAAQEVCLLTRHPCQSDTESAPPRDLKSYRRL